MTEPLFLISHGNTPVTEIPGVYTTRTFNCPANITIHFFETVGKQFVKLDAALLCNMLSYAHQSNTLFQTLEELDDKKIKTPFAKKHYYCKKYKNGDVVPNILFTLEDPVTQLGVYNLKGVDGRPHFATFDAKQAGPQWDIQFDADGHGQLLGEKKIVASPQGGKPLFIYNEKKQNLHSVAEKASAMIAPTGVHLDLIIISCRDFISPKLEQVRADAGYITQREPILQNNYYNLFKKIEHVVSLCEQTLGRQLDPRIKEELTISKNQVDKDLTELIRRLKYLTDYTIEGYGDFQDFTINVAVEDHLRGKKIVEPPQNMDYYIPNVHGNTETRANPASVFGQLGGNIYSKITCPITGKEVNVKSKKGLEIVKKYSKYYNAK
jgi:hypothetical protein